MDNPATRALRASLSQESGNSLPMRAFLALLGTGKSPAQAEKAMDAAVDMVVRHVYNRTEVPPSPDRVSTRAVYLSAWHIVLGNCGKCRQRWPIFSLSADVDGSQIMWVGG